MKKQISFFLAAVFAISLAACSDANSASAKESTVDTGAEETQTDSSVSVTESESSQIAPFEEQTIVDNEFCSVILKGINEDDMWGYSWDVYLENKTDKTLMFGMENTSVNGFMSEPLWAQEVAPGKKSNETITWMSSDFEKNGIDPSNVTTVTFTLNVYDSEDWTADRLVDDTFTIYPKGEEAATETSREIQASDIVLFATDQCRA